MSTAIEKRPVIIKFSDIKTERVDWLWPGRIPLGMISLIVGDQDLGKSVLTLHMAAKVSTGGSWPDKPHKKVEAGSVLILTAEDDLSRTVKPRLEAAGADMDRVRTISAIKESSKNGDKERGLYNLTQDRDVLVKAMMEVGDVRLVIIDPITAYMEGKKSNDNTDVREFLAPLVKLAEVNRAAIVGIQHLNKDNQKPAAYRILGSIAFTAASRAVWLVAQDPEDEDQRLFVVVKNNLSPSRGGLAFRIEGVPVETDKGLEKYPRCRFEDGVVNKTADDILAANNKKNRGPTKLEEAMDWLAVILCDGPMLVEDIYKQAERAGISKSTLGRAKRELGVFSIDIHDEDGKVCAWKWSLLPKENQSAKDS